MAEDKKCIHILDNGQQCAAWALLGKSHCFSHDPGSRDSKLLAVKKGGMAREIEMIMPLPPVEIKTSQDVVEMLIKTINEVRAGKLHPKMASTIAYLSGQLMRAMEVAEVERKVSELHSVLTARQDYGEEE